MPIGYRLKVDRGRVILDHSKLNGEEEFQIQQLLKTQNGSPAKGSLSITKFGAFFRSTDGGIFYIPNSGLPPQQFKSEAYNECSSTVANPQTYAEDKNESAGVNFHFPLRHSEFANNDATKSANALNALSNYLSVDHFSFKNQKKRNSE